MSFPTSFQKYTRELTANVPIVVGVAPSQWILVSSADAEIVFRPQEMNKVQMELGLGVKFDGEFTTLQITSETTQTISFYTGTGDIIDNRLVGQIDITGGIRLAGNTGIDHAAVTVGLAATLIKAANTTRGTILIQNLGTDHVYIGGPGVTVANGIQVNKNGGFASITAQPALYGISLTAGMDVRYMDETL